MWFFSILFVFSIFTFSISVNAEDGHHDEDSHAHEEGEHSKDTEEKPKEKEHHDHDKSDEEEEHSHDDHKKHGDKEAEEAHAHEDEHGHGGHEDHADEAFGQNKAIVAVMDEGDKFRLHAESIKFLDLEFASVTHRKEDEYTVPSSALVRFQNHTGIYRVVGNDVFEMLHLDVLSEEEGRAVVKSKNLKPEDRVVISKLGNLRAAQLQASGQGGEGHAH